MGVAREDGAMARATLRTLAPRVARHAGSIADLETVARLVIALVRVSTWGLLVWVSAAHPAFAPAVSGVIIGDLITWVVRRAVCWRHESHARVMFELAAYAGIMAWWADAAAMPTRMEDRGVFGLALLAAIALKTLPAVYLWLHGED